MHFVTFVVDFGFLELRGVPFACFARPGLAKGCPKGSREGLGRSRRGSGWVRGGPGGVPWGPLGSRGGACSSFGGALARPWELFGALGSLWGRLCGATVVKPLRLSSEKLALESCVLVVWAALERSVEPCRANGALSGGLPSEPTAQPSRKERSVEPCRAN